MTDLDTADADPATGSGATDPDLAVIAPPDDDADRIDGLHDAPVDGETADGETADGLRRARSAPFPDAPRRTKGYEKRAVDAFLDAARRSFEHGDDSVALTAAEVRRAAFPLVRHGYAIPTVDAALGRVEDAFAARERSSAVSLQGSQAWVGDTRVLAQEVLDRLSRRRGRRFARAGLLRYGYRIDEVDIVCDRISGFLAEGAPVSVEQVRSVAFRMQRRGYRETQVDAVLDAVVQVMLAVR